LAIVGAEISVWQFILQQQQANRRPFLQKQLDLCFEVSDTAARSASEPDPAEWENQRRTLWRLYWGTLSIVEDPDVARAMVNFGVLLDKQSVSNPTLPMGPLQDLSYDLALKALVLILESWR
jgi:hypothetical protein